MGTILSQISDVREPIIRHDFRLALCERRPTANAISANVAKPEAVRGIEPYKNGYSPHPIRLRKTSSSPVSSNS